MPQCAFLGHLRVSVRVTLSTHTHSFTWSRICIELSSAVFKICHQWSVNVSSSLRSEVHCMQTVICSLQSANVRHRSASRRHRIQAFYFTDLFYYPVAGFVETMKTIFSSRRNVIYSISFPSNYNQRNIFCVVVLMLAKHQRFIA